MNKLMGFLVRWGETASKGDYFTGVISWYTRNLDTKNDVK